MTDRSICITPENLPQVVDLLRETHGSYAAAGRATGVSAAYFSRVASGDLRPKDIRAEIQQKLERGLPYAQRRRLRDREDLKVCEASPPYGMQSKAEIVEWLESLSPDQFAALQTMMEMMTR